MTISVPRRHLDWSVAMTAVRRDPATIADSLASLAGAGWDQVAVYWDHEKKGPWPNFQRAITDMACRRQQWILICQDDIQVTEGLRGWLDREFFLHLPCNGVFSFYTPTSLSKPADPPGWHQLNRVGSYGALAMAFHLSTARRLIHDFPCPDRPTQTDYWIARWCRDHDVPYYFHHPSFVRHTGTVSSLPNPNVNEADRQCGAFLPRLEGGL